MNAIEYLESKGVFMQPDKRRYKIIKRNKYAIYVLKSDKVSLAKARLKLSRDFSFGLYMNQAWDNLAKAFSTVKLK